MFERTRAFGSTAYSSSGFRRFLDEITRYGLEAIGLYYGVYRAEVVGNEDPSSPGSPDPNGRLELNIPSVDGASRRTTRIAYPVFPMFGPGYGFKSIPPVGGYVWVIYERGRPDLPLWIGGWVGDGDFTSDIESTDVHAWVSPQGHRILLDDTDGGETITVKHKNGSTSIEMDSEGSISITNASGKKVNIGDGAVNANEAGVLGTTLKSLLEQIIDAINTITVPTPAGTSGTPVNAPQFIAIKSQLQTMLSQTIQVK